MLIQGAAVLGLEGALNGDHMKNAQTLVTWENNCDHSRTSRSRSSRARPASKTFDIYCGAARF